MSVMRAPRPLSAGNIYRTGVAFQSWVISGRPNESRVTVEVDGCVRVKFTSNDYIFYTPIEHQVFQTPNTSQY